MGLEQEDTMSTTTEFSIVAVVIAALLGTAFHLNRVQAWPPVTAAHATAVVATTAADPATTGSTRR
jgi:ABC-type amino acid transport system permease subunit